MSDKALYARANSERNEVKATLERRTTLLRRWVAIGYTNEWWVAVDTRNELAKDDPAAQPAPAAPPQESAERATREFWHVGTNADEVLDEKCGDDPEAPFCDAEEAFRYACDGEHVYRVTITVQRTDKEGK